MRVLNITPCRPVDKRATVGPCPAAARRCANHEAGSSGASQTPKLATFLTAAAASVLLAQTMPAMAQLEVRALKADSVPHSRVYEPCTASLKA